MNRSITLCLIAVILFAASAFAQDAVRIESREAVDTRVPIAVPPFAAEDPELHDVASEMAEVIAADLEFTGLYKLLPDEQYPAGFDRFLPDVTRVDFGAWRKTKAENLVYGNIRREENEYVCELRLFDLFSKSQLVGQELRVKAEFPRLAPHRFSEEILRYLDGVPGIGSTEIVFSAGETGRKEIYVADYDGANAQQVTRHNSVSIKPKISPDGHRIAYLSYKDRYPFLYIYDRRDGKSVLFSKEVGLNIAPAWAPGGERLALTLSKDGNAEIYLKDADGTNLTRLTDNRSGDTSPAFSPDGEKIAFVSDRAGSTQIFVMNPDGSGAERVTFQGGNSYDPAWSPDGKHIAYVAERRGEGLEIYLMEADGTNPQRVTNSQGSNESPTWSPDSRHLMYMTTRSGRAQVWSYTIETGEERPVPRIKSLRTEGPHWGPRRR